MKKKQHFFMVKSLIKTLTATATATAGRPYSTFAIKTVTKSNFAATLSALRRHVRDADFVAIDLEMTGVASAPWRESSEFDRFDVKYLKVKDSADKFAVVQFGVCPFRWDGPRQSFVAQPHNFYIFPRQEVPVDGPSYDFLCQTSSIDFLARYQFDFNACIREGISYLSRAQEEAAKAHLMAAGEDVPELLNNVKEVREIPLVRISDILFTERIRKRISEWHDGLSKVTTGGSDSRKGSESQFETIFFKMRPALKLNGFTSRQLRLIQLVTEKYFRDLAYIRISNASSTQQVIVYTGSQIDRDSLMKEVKDNKRKEAEAKIEAAVGFRHVIDLLSSERKLIVGHNCFLDIAHIYRKFIGPLPSDTEEYVSSVHEHFPYIIDTKILLKANNTLLLKLKKANTSLSNAFAALCPQIASGGKTSGLAHDTCVKVEVQVDDMRSANWNSGAKHEAGYDAFMTGCIFAQACRHLGVDFKFQTSPDLTEEEELQEHMNVLYLSWSNGDTIDMRTGKPTSNTSSRYQKIQYANVVVLWGFSSKLKARDIQECFSKTFGYKSVTSVCKLDETAVFVQFSNPELVAEFLELKATIEKHDDLISVLHPLSKLLEGGGTRASSYEFYKEICASPISKVFFADQAEAVGIRWNTKHLRPEFADQNSGARECQRQKMKGSHLHTEPLYSEYLAEAIVGK